MDEEMITTAQADEEQTDTEESVQCSRDNGESAEKDDIEVPEAVFERDLAAIKQAYPEETAESISELGDEFLRLMSAGAATGLSPVTAYAATHTESILRSREKQLVKKAASDMESKSHLRSVGGVSASRGDVPSGIFDKYRLLLPNASDAEIRRHYFNSQND